MTAAWRLPFETSAPLSDDPPIPILADFDPGTGDWTCTFNKPLQPATLDFANWTIRALGFLRTTTAASSSGSVVSGTSVLGAADPGPDVISFTPPPFDVLDLEDRPAAAFVGFTLDIG